MDIDRLGNILGAFANSIADAVLQAAEHEVKVSGPSAAAIALIKLEPGISIETLRNGLRLTHGGTVRLINRLENGALVRRKTSTSDRRAVSLYLTENGEVTCARLHDSRHRVLAEALSVLSEEEKKNLEVVVEKILKTSVRTIEHAYAVCRLCDGDACEDCPLEESLEDVPAI